MQEQLMIDVENLTKRYAGHRAVRDVSFSVRRGEIVGLLGLNGAGKTTILRILACYMPATSGTVRVADRDVFTQAAEVRRHIGYMPEHNPLHQDMRVREYLRFRASLKGINRHTIPQSIERVLQLCGLTDVHRKLIAHLSKGYQQRVGLADALIHQPELIILDEPTIGLDPNQIRSVRQLIKELGRHHTILISTHLLPEVEMTCNRVLILHEGRILASDSPENLQKREGGQVVAEIAAPIPDLKNCWDQAPDVETFNLAPMDGDYVRCCLTARPGVDLRSEVFRATTEHGWKLRELTSNRHSLEDIFLRVTRADKEEAP